MRKIKSDILQAVKMRFEKGNVWIFSTENSILEYSYSSNTQNATVIYCLRSMWLFSYWTIVAIYVVAGISSRFFLQKIIIYEFLYIFVLKYFILKCNYIAIIGITLVCCICVCEVCTIGGPGQESYSNNPSST